MSPPRISIFLPSLGGGGAERSMVLLAGAFQERGPAVDLVLADRSGPFLDAVPSGVRIVDLEAGRVLRALPRLRRYLRETGPDVLLSTLRHANVAALLAARFAGSRTPIVVSEHSVPSSVPDWGTAKDRLLVRFLPWLYRRAAGIVAVSEGVARDLSERVGIERSRITVIPNPIDLRAFSAPTAEPIDDPWFAAGAPPVILGIGRLAPVADPKGLAKAIEETLDHPTDPARLRARAGEFEVGAIAARYLDLLLPGL